MNITHIANVPTYPRKRLREGDVRSTENSIPQPNTLGNLWQILYGTWKIQSIGEVKLSALPLPSSQAGIATFDTIADCEIKAIFRVNGSINNTLGGIVFRYMNVNSYWRFYIKYTNTGCQVNLESIGATISVFKSVYVNFGDSKTYVLKVILNNSFISVFYNDLFLWSVKNDHNVTRVKHGLTISGGISTFFCKKINILK